MTDDEDLMEEAVNTAAELRALQAELEICNRQMSRARTEEACLFAAGRGSALREAEQRVLKPVRAAASHPTQSAALLFAASRGLSGHPLLRNVGCAAQARGYIRPPGLGGALLRVAPDDRSAHEHG